MADLEKMAIKRDRGYLIRLIVSLALGVVASVFIYAGLTGTTARGCATEAITGVEPAAED